MRTEGIYTIMITLAIATAFFYFTQPELCALQRPFAASPGSSAPVFWGVDWRDPVPFYYLCLFVRRGLLCRRPLRRALDLRADACRRCATTSGACARSATTSPPTRSSPGSSPASSPGSAGVLLVWFNGRISPGTVGVGPAINVLVIAVVGGLRHPIGPFLGALVFVLLQTFAIDLVGAERFNTLIGLVFLVIVFASPDGILGLWARARPHLAQKSLRSES